MKRLAAVAAVMLFAACAPRDEATVDTPAAPAMAPAPADTFPADTIILHEEHDPAAPAPTPAQP